MYFVMCVSIGGEHQGSALWGEHSLIINLRKPRAVPNVALKSITYRELDLRTMRFKVVFIWTCTDWIFIKICFQQNGEYFNDLPSSSLKKMMKQKLILGKKPMTIAPFWSLYIIYGPGVMYAKLVYLPKVSTLKTILFRSYMVFIVGMLKD